MCDIQVTQEDLHDLLKIFEKKSFETGSCEEGTEDHAIVKKCAQLFKLDYNIIELDNKNGQYCSRYPGCLFFPEYQHSHTGMAPSENNMNSPNSLNTNSGNKNGIHTFLTFGNSLHPQQQQSSPPPPSPLLPPSPLQLPAATLAHSQKSQQNTIYEDLYDITKIRELIATAKYARCRQRFVFPVIMFRGKYICRSATISVMHETYGRKVVDYAYDCLNGTNTTDRSPNDEENNECTDESLMSNLNEPLPFSYQEAIKSDVQLLNALNVSTIVDLMVEKKKVKYFMTVSSSEKADPEKHYEDFNILSLPYPGCEFFKNFRDNNYMAKNLFYNWKLAFNDAIISVPKIGPLTDMDISWSDYKKWDLVLITQNYLKATLKYIQEENSGLLIHCISGWDRTPLFISLVRLSLWADGLIHQSLNSMQIAYFTVAYDWYLFGHQLPTRLKHSEDIMFFCFHLLKYITDEEFSVTEHRRRTKTSSSSGSSVIVLKTDEETSKEDLLLNFDNDSNESFANCDMLATDNFLGTTTAAPATSIAGGTGCGRSPNSKRTKTSPISVPGTNAARQRHESTSSHGSWQVVTDTGSIDSVLNGSYMARDCSDDSFNGISKGSTKSSNTLNAGKEAAGSSTGGLRNPLTLRKQRLNSVRAFFIQTYGKTIGLKFKEGSSMTLGTLVGTLAEQLF